MIRFGALVLALLLVGLAGCAPDAATRQSVRWTRIALPDGVRPTTFGTDQQKLIIGGRQGSGPWLATVDGSDAVDPVALGKHSPYAFTAEFVSIGIWGDRIAALGNIHGGAHGNSRWTDWTGTTRRIDDYPQSLETFGGVNGGDLTAIVINNHGPLITGSYRFGNTGLDGGIWVPYGRPPGKRWSQPDPTGTDLDTTRSVQVVLQSAAATTSDVVLVGSATHLDSGVHQVAAAWIRSDGSTWKRIELPGGKRSEALSASCWRTGDRTDCLIAGTQDGRLAAWTLTGDRAATVPLPAVSITGSDPKPLAVGSAKTAAVAYGSAPGAGLIMRTRSNWQRIAAPQGKFVAAAVVGSGAYMITETGGNRTVFYANLPG